MSVWLFNICMDKRLRMALLNEEVVDLGTVTVRGLTFADDFIRAESVDDFLYLEIVFTADRKIDGNIQAYKEG